MLFTELMTVFSVAGGHSPSPDWFPLDYSETPNKGQIDLNDETTQALSSLISKDD